MQSQPPVVRVNVRKLAVEVGVSQVNIHIKAFLALQKQSLANNLEAKVRVKTQISIHSWGISEVQSMTSNAPKTCTQRLSLPGRSASNKATSCSPTLCWSCLIPINVVARKENTKNRQTSAPPIKSRPRQPCRACLFSFVEKGFSGGNSVDLEAESHFPALTVATGPDWKPE
ncbi:hypothetical protein FJTKL_07126 [Diaporthe vaccinii]|uniref:Uncharacterized protein n=1 Tax=Diaporthe vaccinii TaxID=105482 RepID=A0ABR4EV78_9PEZI